VVEDVAVEAKGLRRARPPLPARSDPCDQLSNLRLEPVATTNARRRSRTFTTSIRPWSWRCRVVQVHTLCRDGHAPVEFAGRVGKRPILMRRRSRASSRIAAPRARREATFLVDEGYARSRRSTSRGEGARPSARTVPPHGSHRHRPRVHDPLGDLPSRLVARRPARACIEERYGGHLRRRPAVAFRSSVRASAVRSR